MNDVTFDTSLCIRCRACVQDCVAGVIDVSAEGYPEIADGGMERCIGCQHCLAICPVGAVTYDGISGRSLGALGSLPESGRVMNLLRQRRSIRQFRDENLSEEELARVLSCLRWVPTGCNDHSLRFAVVRDKGEMAFFRHELVRMLKRLRFWGVVRVLFPRYRKAVDAAIEGADLVFRGAPHMIVAMVPRRAPCREADPWIALSQFEVLAQSMGIGTCWCGFGMHAIRRIRSMRQRLEMPRGYEVSGVMLFGKPSVSYCRPTVPREVEVTYLG